MSPRTPREPVAAGQLWQQKKHPRRMVVVTAVIPATDVLGVEKVLWRDVNPRPTERRQTRGARDLTHWHASFTLLVATPVLDPYSYYELSGYAGVYGTIVATDHVNTHHLRVSNSVAHHEAAPSPTQTMAIEYWPVTPRDQRHHAYITLTGRHGNTLCVPVSDDCVRAWLRVPTQSMAQLTVQRAETMITSLAALRVAHGAESPQVSRYLLEQLEQTTT